MAASDSGRCLHRLYNCPLERVKKSKYCIKHILQNESSPFRQCSFVYSGTTQRCSQAVHIESGLRLCHEHVKRRFMLDRLAAHGHEVSSSMADIVPKWDRYNSETSGSNIEEPSCSRNPFVDMDGRKVRAQITNAFEHDTDVSESDKLGMDTFVNVDGSDEDVADNESAHPLSNAGVYTEEEVLLMQQQSMIKLQRLYMNELQHLEHLYVENRSIYLKALQKKENMAHFMSLPQETPEDVTHTKHFKALARYQTRRGLEALMARKLHQRRTLTSRKVPTKPDMKNKCTFTEGGVKCGKKALPQTKYCSRHILKDNHQILFKSCDKVRGDNTCPEPVIRVTEETRCILHSRLEEQYQPQLKPVINVVPPEEGSIPSPKEVSTAKMPRFNLEDEVIIMDIDGNICNPLDEDIDLQLALRDSAIVPLHAAEGEIVQLQIQGLEIDEMDQVLQFPKVDSPVQVFAPSKIPEEKSAIKNTQNVVHVLQEDETPKDLEYSEKDDGEKTFHV